MSTKSIDWTENGPFVVVHFANELKVNALGAGTHTVLGTYPTIEEAREVLRNLRAEGLKGGIGITREEDYKRNYEKKHIR